MGKINKSHLSLLLACAVFALVSSLLFQNCGEAFKSSSSVSPADLGNALQNPAPVAKDATIMLDEDSVKQGQLAATRNISGLSSGMKTVRVGEISCGTKTDDTLLCWGNSFSGNDLPGKISGF